MFDLFKNKSGAVDKAALQGNVEGIEPPNPFESSLSELGDYWGHR